MADISQQTADGLNHNGCPIPFDAEEFLTRVRELAEAAYGKDDDVIRETAAGTVSPRHPARWNYQEIYNGV